MDVIILFGFNKGYNREDEEEFIGVFATKEACEETKQSMAYYDGFRSYTVPLEGYEKK